MHMAKYLKEKNHIIFSYNKNSKICINMHFGFNNQFIKVTRTRPIFQKFQKYYFFSFSIWVTTLHVRCIPDIKFFCWR